MPSVIVTDVTIPNVVTDIVDGDMVTTISPPPPPPYVQPLPIQGPLLGPQGLGATRQRLPDELPPDP